MPDRSILVINTGSSSLKYGLYARENGEEQLLFGGSADGIARDGTIDLRDSNDRVLRSEKLNFASQADALDHAVQWLRERFSISYILVADQLLDPLAPVVAKLSQV